MKCDDRVFLLLFVLLLMLPGCTAGRKLAYLKRTQMNTVLSLPENDMSSEDERLSPLSVPDVDTLVVKDHEGNDVYIMNAIKDESTGEMVANESLVAAVVTARFRNVAERFGKVDIRFQITVPAELQDTRWQLVLSPSLKVQEDSIDMDDVIVTGRDFRRSQLKGYQQYRKFLDRIVTDSLKLVDGRSLEIFIERNFPEVASFKTDSSFVSDEQFESAFGVSVHDVVEHYKRAYLLRRNKRLSSRQDEMWHRYVKTPILSEGVRIDTVINKEGNLVFDYVQTINVPSGLKKVDLLLKGSISDSESKIYDIPESDKLTFYISSLSTLVSDEVRYKTEVITRNLDVVRNGLLAFRSGSGEIDEDLSDNALELEKIKSILRDLVTDRRFEIDSIVVSANASPEGALPQNNSLCSIRARNASLYFERYLSDLDDSLRLAGGVFVEVGEDFQESRFKDSHESEAGKIRFLCRSGGENWSGLERLVASDSLMSGKDKDDFNALVADIKDLDVREFNMKRKPYYKYVREQLYPLLRTVEFKFCLHRNGMITDTVRTEIVDTVYANGVSALMGRDYERALALLSPYEDLNAAVAMIAMERNHSALDILCRLEPDARVDYLSAIVYSRLGDDRKAVECYIRSCRKDRAYISRGNLDPEVSRLIRKYALDYEL